MDPSEERSQEPGLEPGQESGQESGQEAKPPVSRITWLLLALLGAVGLFAGTWQPLPGQIESPHSAHYPAMPQPPAPVAATGELLRVFEEARPAALRIESRCDRPFFAAVPIDVGSGFFISPNGTVLTAYHVVQRQQLRSRGSCPLGYRGVDANGREYQLELVAFDAYLDLALMKAQVDGSVPHLELARQPPRIGAEVLAIGNSRGQLLSDRTGVVSRIDVSASEPQFASGTIELTAALAPGDSGGPVLDRSGSVVGVVSYISFQPSLLAAEGDRPLSRFFGDGRAPQFASYAVPVLHESPTLESLQAGVSRDVPVIGFQVAFDYDPGRSGRSSQGSGHLGDRPGVVVGVVEPGGPAAQAGLRSLQERILLDESGEPIGRTLRGDVIVAVDGVPTPNLDRLLRVVRARGVGTRVTLTVQRGSQARELDLQLAGHRRVFR